MRVIYHVVWDSWRSSSFTRAELELHSTSDKIEKLHDTWSSRNVHEQDLTITILMDEHTHFFVTGFLWCSSVTTRISWISRRSLAWLPNGGSGVAVGICHAVFGVCVDGGQDSPPRQTCRLLEQLQPQVRSSHTHTQLFRNNYLYTRLHEIQTMWPVYKVGNGDKRYTHTHTRCTLHWGWAMWYLHSESWYITSRYVFSEYRHVFVCFIAFSLKTSPSLQI